MSGLALIIYTRNWYRRETNRKEKKTTTHPFDQPFFFLTQLLHAWIFILPNPISKLYKYFTYILLYKLGHYSILINKTALCIFGALTECQI
jgi:hypothetical protein